MSDEVWFLRFDRSRPSIIVVCRSCVFRFSNRNFSRVWLTVCSLHCLYRSCSSFKSTSDKYRLTVFFLIRKFSVPKFSCLTRFIVWRRCRVNSRRSGLFCESFAACSTSIRELNRPRRSSANYTRNIAVRQIIELSRFGEVVQVRRRNQYQFLRALPMPLRSAIHETIELHSPEVVLRSFPCHTTWILCLLPSTFALRTATIVVSTTATGQVLSSLSLMAGPDVLEDFLYRNLKNFPFFFLV